jgi:hypothetical protein
LPVGDVMYMFGLATVCWATWKTRNKICFDKILLRNVGEILFYAIALMRYWAGLHPEETQGQPDDEDHYVLGEEKNCNSYFAEDSGCG